MSMFQRDLVALTDSNFTRLALTGRQWSAGAFQLRDGSGNFRDVTARTAVNVPATDGLTGEAFEALRPGQRGIFLFTVGFTGASGAKEYKVTHEVSEVTTDYTGKRSPPNQADDQDDLISMWGPRIPGIPKDHAPFAYMAIENPDASGAADFTFGVSNWNNGGGSVPALKCVGSNGVGLVLIGGLPPSIPWDSVVDMA